MRRRLAFICVVAVLLLAACFPAVAPAATINVSAATAGIGNDEATDTDGLCGLREAVIAANTNAAVGPCPAGTAGSDTVSLPAGTFKLELPGVGPESVNASDGALGGDLDLIDQTAIEGAGPAADDHRSGPLRRERPQQPARHPRRLRSPDRDDPVAARDHRR